MIPGSRPIRRLLPIVLLVAGSPTVGAAVVEGGAVVIERLPATLEGTWELALGEEPPGPDTRWRPVEVPQPWEAEAAPGYDGHAWYRLRIRSVPSLAGQRLGIAFPRIRDADEAFLDGRPIGSTGAFPPDFAKASVYSRIYPLGELDWRPGGYELLVRVYNHARYGGITFGAPRVDHYERLVERQHLETSAIVAVAVFFLMVAANHVFLFVHARHIRSNLLFALFALASSLYVLTYSPHLLPGLIPLNLLFRLNVTLFPVSVALLVAFLFAFLERPPALAARCILLLLGVAALFALTWPRMDALYAAVTATELLSVLLAVVLGVALVQAVRRRAPYARSLATVTAIVLLAGLYDIGRDRQLLPPPPVSVAGMVFPFGFIPFYVVLGLILAHRYWETYRSSITDRMTGLLQRHHFMERLAQEVARAERTEGVVVVAMADLDGFKRVNDTHSHAAGDAVLQAVARTLRDSVRPFDLTARFGGDELCLAMVVSDEVQARETLERLRLRVQHRPIVFDGTPLSITLSVGAVVRSREHAGVPADLLRQADAALYLAKAAGGNRVVLNRGEPAAAARETPSELPAT